MSRPRILITRRWPEPVEALLRDRYDLHVDPHDRPLTATELTAAMGAFDIVCPTITDRIDAAVLGGAPRVRALCNFGAGLDHIDLNACRALGVVVTNTPDVLTDDTADLAIMLALMTLRRAGEGERLVRAGRWTGWTPTQLMGGRLTGRTIGLIGFGRIGQAVARRAHHGFGMTVLYHSRTRADVALEAESGARHVSLDTVLETADIVSLHCPGGAATRHLINAERLARMRAGAVLINTARGDVVDQTALVDALSRGVIAGAGLDVYDGEPAVPAALTAMENVVLLPHLGSATLESRTAMGMRAIENLEAVLAGHAPRDRRA